MRILKPKKLQKGDTIGVIAPASPPKDISRVEKGAEYLERLGYRVELGQHVYSKKGYLAGEDSERLNDLHAMFANKDIKAIIAVRGGYGTTRLLNKINYKLIRENPKILVGHSDLTALQMAIYQKSKLVTFAGPMLYGDFGGDIDPFMEENFWKMITSSRKIGKLNNPENEKFFVLVKGRAEGRIIGGNLSIICALAGTGYLPSFKDTILLLEEIREAPYRIDRMFTQLKQIDVFKQISGLILGRFVDCYESDKLKETMTLNEVIADHLASQKIPILYNFKHGHIADSLTIPFGLKCKVNSSRCFVEINDNAVV